MCLHLGLRHTCVVFIIQQLPRNTISAQYFSAQHTYCTTNVSCSKSGQVTSNITLMCPSPWPSFSYLCFDSNLSFLLANVTLMMYPSPVFFFCFFFPISMASLSLLFHIFLWVYFGCLISCDEILKSQHTLEQGVRGWCISQVTKQRGNELKSERASRRVSSPSEEVLSNKNKRHLVNATIIIRLHFSRTRMN